MVYFFHSIVAQKLFCSLPHTVNKDRPKIYLFRKIKKWNSHTCRNYAEAHVPKSWENKSLKQISTVIICQDYCFIPWMVSSSLWYGPIATLRYCRCSHRVYADLEKCLNLTTALKNAWFFILSWEWDIFREKCLKMNQTTPKRAHNLVKDISLRLSNLI